MQDPSYSLYFQPRNTYFLAQCQGLFGGMVAVVKALLSARMLCHVASMALDCHPYGIMPEATGQESQQKGRHGELCLPTSAN